MSLACRMSRRPRAVIADIAHSARAKAFVRHPKNLTGQERAIPPCLPRGVLRWSSSSPSQAVIATRRPAPVNTARKAKTDPPPRASAVRLLPPKQVHAHVPVAFRGWDAADVIADVIRFMGEHQHRRELLGDIDLSLNYGDPITVTQLR